MNPTLRLIVLALAVAGSLLWGPEARFTLCVGDDAGACAVASAADGCCATACCADEAPTVADHLDCSCCVSLPVGGDADAVVEVRTGAETVVADAPVTAVVVPAPRAPAAVVADRAGSDRVPVPQRVLPLLV